MKCHIFLEGYANPDIFWGKFVNIIPTKYYIIMYRPATVGDAYFSEKKYGGELFQR